MSAHGSCDLNALRAPSAEAIARRLRGSLVTVTTGRRGAGTGVVWEDGLIVTNHHVAPTSDARVAFGAQQEGAPVIARDRGRDLALLELRSHNVRPVAKRSATSLRVGELVIAIGYPWGGQAAATVGVIAQAPATRDRGEAIHVVADVRLAPGNSGGPLADAAGRVVGINHMISGGLALAIGSETVDEFVRRGARDVGALGIEMAVVPTPSGRQHEHPLHGESLMVTSVLADSAAERAGLIPGDLIVEVQGVRGSVDMVLQSLRDMTAGRSLRLTLMRAGAPRVMEVIPEAA